MMTTSLSELTLRVTGELEQRQHGFLLALGEREPPAGGQATFATAEPWTYVYDETTNQYRDLRSGQFISVETIRQLRDGFVESRRAAVEDLARQLGSGQLGLDEWEAAMRGELQMILG